MLVYASNLPSPGDISIFEDLSKGLASGSNFLAKKSLKYFLTLRKSLELNLAQRKIKKVLRKELIH